MLNIREYVKVQSLEEAYELNQKRTNKVIGGMLLDEDGQPEHPEGHRSFGPWS